MGMTCDVCGAQFIGDLQYDSCRLSECRVIESGLSVGNAPRRHVCWDCQDLFGEEEEYLGFMASAAIAAMKEYRHEAIKKADAASKRASEQSEAGEERL